MEAVRTTPIRAAARGWRAWTSACIAIWALGCDAFDDAAAAELAVPTAVISRGSIEQTMLLTGELEAENSVTLVAPRTDNWQIAIKWLAEEGSAVEKGDPVVEFDNAAVVQKLSDLEVNVVEAGVELETQQAETAVQIAEKSFAVESARAEVAKAELDTSVPESLVSRREFQDARIALQRAKVALTTAGKDLAALRGGGRLDEQVKRVMYEKSLRAYESAGDELDALQLTAPRDGIVLIRKSPREGRKLQVGDNVWPGLAVAELPDLSKTLVRATLSDVDDGRMVPGMAVSCTVDAFPEATLQGVVRAVAPVAQSLGKGSTRQGFSVVIALEGPLSEQMRPGLSVKVEVPSVRLNDVLLVPRGAVDFEREASGGATVRRDDGTEVTVELGLCDADRCVVESGLAEGDVVRMPGGAA